MTFQDSHLSSVMGTMIYVVALAEDVARGQADPNRLNDHAGTSMQCDDAGAGGDWMHSAPPSPPMPAFHPCGTCLGKAVCPGCSLQPPGVRNTNIPTHWSLAPLPSLPVFFARSFNPSPFRECPPCTKLSAKYRDPRLDQGHGA